MKGSTNSEFKIKVENVDSPSKAFIQSIPYGAFYIIRYKSNDGIIALCTGPGLMVLGAGNRYAVTFYNDQQLKIESKQSNGSTAYGYVDLSNVYLTIYTLGGGELTDLMPCMTASMMEAVA